MKKLRTEDCGLPATPKGVFAMVHLRALPGTPQYDGDDDRIISQAIQEAEIYRDAGVQGIIIENMHDIPYLNSHVGPEITAMMTMAAAKVKEISQLPCGIQVLAGANQQALAIAKVAKLDFIRAEGFVFAHVGDEGIIDACAGDLLRYRKQIDAQHIKIYTDIKKKHSAHSITQDTDIVETSKAAHFFLSDGLIVTGTSTGTAANIEELRAVQAATPLPTFVGSGVTPHNVNQYLAIADAVIVGSYFKKDGYWTQAVQKDRVHTLLDAISD